MSAHEWITEYQDRWINRLHCKIKQNDQLRRMMDILMNNMDQIACIDTEFFVGKYPHTHRRFGYGLPLDVAIGRLYNIGVATGNGKSVSILIKHPNLSLSDRLNLFSSHREQQKMLEFLRPVLQHHVNEEGAERVNVEAMDLDELEFYFNRYAVFPRTAWDILSNIIDSYPYLMHHFSHWDHKLVCLLAEYCGCKNEFEKVHEWYNTSKLCHALFPNNVITRGLGYLSKRLCHNVDIQFAEHLGGSDATALMQLLKELRNEFINAGFNEFPVNESSLESSTPAEKDDDTDCELYEWIAYKLNMPQYYELLCDEGFDDDVSLVGNLSDLDLREIGIAKKAHRLKIVKEAMKLL